MKRTRVTALARFAALTILLGVPLGARSADTEPPSRPEQLTLTAKTGTSVSLAWNASTDNVGATGYDILRDGAPIGFSAVNSYLCTGLTAQRRYTFRVRAQDAAGNVSALSHALLATPQPGGLQPPPSLVRTQFFAVVLNYNPHIYADGAMVRADQYYGSRDVTTLIAQYMDLMKKASGGQMKWTVAGRFDFDEWPAGEGSPAPVYDPWNCVELRSQGYEYRASYPALLHDPRFGLIDRANRGELDAVWVFSAPGVGFWETAMAGPTPYWINGAGTTDPAMTRNIVFYGFGKAGHQGVGFMCENTCHMTEIILRDRIAPAWPLNVVSRNFVTLNLDNPARVLTAQYVNDWVHFTQAEAASWDPVLVAPGGAQAGLSHFPPAALYNYDWSTFHLDFNSTGPLHVYDGSWSLVNGEYQVLSGDGVKVLAIDGMTLRDNLGDYHPPLAFSDGEVELTVRVMNPSTLSHAGLLFRVSKCGAGANQVRGYYLGLNACQDQMVLARLDNAFIPLTNVPCPILTNTSYRLRLETRGDRIQAFLNDSLTPVLSFSDATYITGGFGLAAYNTEAYFDNLNVVSHLTSTADKWYAYPTGQSIPRDLSPLEWDGDRDVAMDAFYGWWWEHVPKNGGGHYATNLPTGSTSFQLNNWWPYVFDHNRFSVTCPYPDIVFPPEDLEPPSPPIGVVGIALGASKVGLAWNEPADNVGVTRYSIYRNGAFLRKTSLPYLTDTRLVPGTIYAYEVRACDGSGNVSAPVPVAVTTLSSAGAGIVNGGFEFVPQVSGWMPDAFLFSQAKFEWEPAGVGRHGSRCVSINCTNFNDARWIQTVTGLEPGATYWLTGWIKGTNIVREPNRSTAACLCLDGTWNHTRDYLDGNFDWQQVSMSFVAPLDGVVTIGCRLGYWSNTASGKVWFDDIAILRPASLKLEQPCLLPDGHFGFSLVAPPNSVYHIERSTDLSSWTEIQTFFTAHPITELTVDALPSVDCFYRAMGN